MVRSMAANRLASTARSVRVRGPPPGARCAHGAQLSRPNQHQPGDPPMQSRSLYARTRHIPAEDKPAQGCSEDVFDVASDGRGQSRVARGADDHRKLVEKRQRCCGAQPHAVEDPRHKHVGLPQLLHLSCHHAVAVWTVRLAKMSSSMPFRDDQCQAGRESARCRAEGIAMASNIDIGRKHRRVRNTSSSTRTHCNTCR